MNDNPNSANLPTPNANDLATALGTALTAFSDYADTLADKSNNALKNMTNAYKQFHKSLTELSKMRDTISKFADGMRDMTVDLTATVECFNDDDDIFADAMRNRCLIAVEEGENEEEE